MITTEVYNRAVDIAKGILTEEQLEGFKTSMSYLICDIKVGDMVDTPRGRFKVTGICDNGNYMPNNFIITNSHEGNTYHCFKVTDCKLI